MTNANGMDDVLLVTPQTPVSAAVESALASNGRAWSATTVRSVREMLAHLGASGARAVLVDLDAHPEQTLAELERITLQYPATRFVALASALEQQLLLSAMQSGVRHVLLKHQIAGELVPLLHRLAAAAGPRAASRGEVFTILSAGGGCGASTLAVNLADEISTRSGQPALLIDLDLAYGALAILLGVESKYGLDHVLSRSGPIDAHLIGSTATPVTDKLHVLTAPPGDGLSDPKRLDGDRLGQVLEAAAAAYRHVIIDAPRILPGVAALLALGSTRTLLALQLTVKDTRVARGMLATLTQHGVSAGTLVPVVTRYAKRQHMVSLEDAATALGGAKVECVRNDYPGVSRAMDFGQTLAAAAPRSLVRRDVQELAAKIAAPVNAPR